MHPCITPLRTYRAAYTHTHMHNTPYELIQSRDASTYMQWNGPFGALPFISHWEYTRDEAFARET